MENEFLNFLKYFQNFTSDDSVSKKDDVKSEFEKYFPQLKRIRKTWVKFGYFWVLFGHSGLVLGRSG